MRKKILALAFVLAMIFGFAKTADSCQTVSVQCAPGYDGLGYGGWTGLVCDYSDQLFFNSYYCPEEAVNER